ncbi:bifunctional DNA-formamidopyrimidine glycosylase/DNA-(apurinic or apyrimidinic site) lyase [Patescibacteria group bacterium]|nr:bifunctional DNA-formamidopyrimidine glycosylase/DNA-(apurinic or apyrimidinic site) lyase [Patescibacteria group bacterium]
MPELPEVHTIATDLQRKVRGSTIVDIWTDWPKYFRPQTEAAFRRTIGGRRIISVGRRGKNVIFHLSGGYAMLAHQKMTGHFLVGRWMPKAKYKIQSTKKDVWAGQKWVPDNVSGPLGHDRNRFIRLIFFLKDGRMLALSDLRRFAKVVAGPEDEISNLAGLIGLGPEPIAENFTLKDFKTIIAGKKTKIKPLLLDQSFLSGLGNIYADESLWFARIHPARSAAGLTPAELGRLYRSMRRVLKEAIRLRGSSVDDFRDSSGREGRYQLVRRAYGREGGKCPRCGSTIKRMKIGQRSAHFCPHCQKPK